MTTSVSESLREAQLAHESGDWDQAARLLHTILDQNPNNVHALHRYGVLCHHAGDSSQAKEWINRAIELADGPQIADCRTDLAAALLADDRPAEALAECELARDLLPHLTPKLAILQSQAFQDLNQLEDAIDVLRDAIQTYAERTDLRLTLARLYQAKQQPQLAAVEYEHVLQIDRQNADAVLQLTHLMLRSNVSIDDRWINRIRTTLPYAHQPETRIHLRFALGAVHEKREEFEHALAAYRQANQDQTRQMLHRGQGLDLEQLEELVAEVIRVFDAQTIQDWQTSFGHEASCATFLIGMPGCGSAQLAEQLARHSDIAHWESAPLFESVVTQLIGPDHSQLSSLSTISAMYWRQTAETYIEKLTKRGPSFARIINPRPGNVLYAGAIAVMFPNAKIVLCRRNREDTLTECYCQPRPFDHIATSDLDVLETVYAQVNRLADHWTSALPPANLLELSFDDLAENSTAYEGPIFEFLNLEQGNFRFRP